MRRLLRGWLALLVVLALVIATMLVRSWQMPSVQVPASPRPGVRLDALACAQRLSLAVRVPTVSTQDDRHAADFDAFQHLLEASFPLAHRELQRERFGHHSLLYVWPGADPHAPAIALLAHQDVVPIAPGSEALWTHAPFSGDLSEGYIWGRGAWDDKSNLMGIMEAVERLVRTGFQPRQTVYLAFGADEELGGDDGARLIAQALKSRGVKLTMALDEGLLITQGIVPGVAAPVALVGVAEKGYLTLHLRAHAQAGHSSMPPATSAVGQLSAAIVRIEQHPMPARLQGVSRELFETVAPHMSGLGRLVLSNLWLTDGLVTWQLTQSPATNAVLRTTSAATLFQAGERETVLPTEANASINLRLLPGDSRAAATQHVRDILAGTNIQIEASAHGSEASPVSGTQTPSFRLIAQTLRELQPELIVAPGLLTGGTDARHFVGLADNIYRFSPIRVQPADLARIHGTNERIAIANYVEMIQFYERLLRNANELLVAQP